MRLPRWLPQLILPQSRRELFFGLPVVAFLVFIGYSAFIDRQPMVSSEYRVLTPEVQQGGIFTIRYKVQWSSRCRVTGFRVIIDGVGFQHSITPDTRFVEEGFNEFDISLPIPPAAAVGDALYHGFIEYECNWLQRIWPLERPIIPRSFKITRSANDSNVEMVCSVEKPVHVKAYCRRRPQVASSR